MGKTVVDVSSSRPKVVASVVFVRVGKAIRRLAYTNEELAVEVLIFSLTATKVEIMGLLVALLVGGLGPTMVVATVAVG